MPQPTFATTTNPTRIICQLGGLALPNGQGTMATYDLNDSVNWFLQDLPEVTMSRKIGISTLAWRARGVYLSDDFSAKKIVLKELFSDQNSGTQSLAFAKAQISQAGEQFLTFDNATQILVKLADWGKPASRRKFSPYLWDLDLTFTCREPWFKDITATTASYAFGNGTASTSITYTGSVFAEPVWKLTVPNSSTATIASLVIKNQMSTEALTVTFPTPLTASAAHTVTIDSTKFTVTDENSKAYDVSGSFPLIYGPANQAQTIATTVTPGTGVVSGVNLVTSWNARWDF